MLPLTQETDLTNLDDKLLTADELMALESDDDPFLVEDYGLCTLCSSTFAAPVPTDGVQA
ncbi:MAG: hypothetical protein QM753_13080 [Thermomicrobiales bacterium]